MTGPEVKCPCCPYCGTRGLVHPGIVQAFCTDPDCVVFTWDPYVPAAVVIAQLEEATPIDLRFLDGSG